MQKINSHAQHNNLYIAACFNRAAERYINAAFMQFSIGNQLGQLCVNFTKRPQIIVDLGGATGYLSRMLHAKYPTAKMLLLDIAENMLNIAQRHKISTKKSMLCADFDYLPFSDNSIDLIFANMSLQWSVDLAHTFDELQRVLTVSGSVILSMPIAGTLPELIASCNKIGLLSHQFVSQRQLKQLLTTARFKIESIYQEQRVLFYPTVFALLRHLQAQGVNGHKQPGLAGLYGKRLLSCLSTCYEEYRQSNGFLPATYEISYSLVHK